MKLVLLPGLDGTGNLFSPLLRELTAFDCNVIPLRQEGPQDYASLTASIRDQLPNENFIIVAESFSGPIGAAIAFEEVEHLKGVIFVATFLSPPRKFLLAISRFLPIKRLSSLSFAKYFHKVLFLGCGADDEVLRLFQETLSELPENLIKARLASMQSLALNTATFNLPAAYIQAVSDKLVPKNKTDEFANIFSTIKIKKIAGPHFILQAKPKQCAETITDLIADLTRRTS